LAFAETAEIIGDGFFVAGRDWGSFRGAYLPRRLVVGVVPELKLQLVNPSEHLCMELLNHQRIAREPTRIEALHLAHQILNFLQRRGIILGKMVKLIQLREPLPVGAFRIGW